MLNYIKIVFSTCALITAGLNSGETEPRLSVMNNRDPDNKILECQLVENGKNSFFCLTSETIKDKRESKSGHKFGDMLFFKYAKIDENTFVLSNDTKSQIFHVQKTKVVYHERLLGLEKSQEKVCVGKMVEKK